jgi:hypothetical protein
MNIVIVKKLRFSLDRNLLEINTRLHTFKAYWVFKRPMPCLLAD